MQRKSLHTTFWSVLLAILLFGISVSGSTLPLVETAVASTDQPNEAQLTASQGLKATLKNTPKFTFSHYFGFSGLNTYSGGGDLLFPLPTLKNTHKLSFLTYLGNATLFPSVTCLTRCLLCSPNAP